MLNNYIIIMEIQKKKKKKNNFYLNKIKFNKIQFN